MEYRFGFERKQLVIIGSGVLLSSALFFIAGVLVGAALGTPEGANALKAASQMAAEQAAAAASKATSKLAQKATATLAEKGPKSLSPMAKQLQAATKEDKDGKGEKESKSEEEESAPAPAPKQSALPASAPATPVVQVSASTSPAGAMPPAALTAMPAPENYKPDKDIYSLQLGAFLDAKVARQLQTDLRERGYRAEIYTAVDSEQREWHAVRIGGFPTLAGASAAAATFTSRERIQALVRRSNAL